MTLYQLTKTLIDEIKARRPDIESESDYYWVYQSHPAEFDEITAGKKEIPAEEIRIKHKYQLQMMFFPMCIAFTPDTLLTLIPKLFGEVENPEYRKKVKALADSYDVHIDDVKTILVYSGYPTKLSGAMLKRYFVDGLWVQSQEAVLEDLLENVRKYL